MAVTIDGTSGVAVPLGTAAAPGVTNTTNPNTGVFYPTSTSIALAVNGASGLTVNASQAIGVGSPPSYGTAGQAILSGGSGGPASWGTIGDVTGEIMMSVASSKTGYLLCDGSVYTRTSYAALAAAIGSPLSPQMYLGNALSGSLAGVIYGANNLLFKIGSAASTTATVANGIQTSSDGITWTMRTGMNVFGWGNSGYGNAVSYGNSVYVCLTNSGATNTLYWQTSADAVTYTARSLSFGVVNTTIAATEVAYGGTSNRHVMQVIWNPQTAVACGTQTSTNHRLMYSADGITWTTADTITDSSNPNTYFSATGVSLAGYSGGFVATAVLNVSGGTTTNYVKYSADGATWTDITANINSVATMAGAIKAVTYTNGRFILSVTGGQIYTSTTGASGSWSLLVTSNSYSTTYVGKISGNANAYFIVNTGYISTDLINWFSMPNMGLGTPKIQVGFSGATRFYGLSSASTISAYYMDLWNYTVATQFVVPKINTYASGTLSSPFASNTVPVNFLIKT